MPAITSRNAKGADLLATDQSYERTWAIQVKTNRKPAKFWLLGKSFTDDVAWQHVYVFVNLRGDVRPDYYVVPSPIVARDGFTSTSKTGSVWVRLRHYQREGRALSGQLDHVREQ
jgi:hypothetical protein